MNPRHASLREPRAQSDDAPQGARTPAHARSLRAHALARTVGMVLTGVLAFGAAGAATAAVTLTGNIDTVDTEKLLADTDRPTVVEPEDPNAGTPLNIVLMGSDTRAGDNEEFATSKGTGGARSDTTMVMHLSADRTRVELVSIPRDTTVDIPSCITSQGKKTVPWRHTKFNASFSQGYSKGGDVASGALCTLTTIETLTDVRMDGFIVIDFAGFQRMIDALGGVELCIPHEIHSKKAGNLTLHPGVQKLKGKTALQYARARHGLGLGDGSDLGRIGRQQELMAALSRTVLSKNLLTDSPALLKFLGATTSSLTMSQNFASVQGLTGLAYSLRNVRPDTITFMTVPWRYDPTNGNNVIWTSDATTVWDNMKHDRPLQSDPDAPSASASAGASDGATASATPSKRPSDTATASASATSTPTPSPTKTKKAGQEAFTGADVTSVCG